MLYDCTARRMCGSPVQLVVLPSSTDEWRHKCSSESCGHIDYHNPRMVVGTICENAAGQILLCRCARGGAARVLRGGVGVARRHVGAYLACSPLCGRPHPQESHRALQGTLDGAGRVFRVEWWANVWSCCAATPVLVPSHVATRTRPRREHSGRRGTGNLGGGRRPGVHHRPVRALGCKLYLSASAAACHRLVCTGS